MECDSDHSLIEKQKKSCALQIVHPRDCYTNYNKLYKQKQSFQVYEIYNLLK